MTQGTAAAEMMVLTQLINATWEISMNSSRILYDQSHTKNLIACKLHRVQFILYGNMKSYIDLRTDVLVNLRMLQKPS